MTLAAWRGKVGLALVAMGAAALLALAVLQGEPLRGYDAGTHVFFASHYLSSWWNTWEPRWYGGFDVVSYPPLAHQLLALLAMVFGFGAGLKIELLILIVAFPFVSYGFARGFVAAEAAYVSAAVSLTLPALALILIADGQIPGVLSLELLLLATASGMRFATTGKRVHLAATVAGVSAAAAAHHATPVLLGPFLVLATAWKAIQDGTASDAPAPEIIRRLVTTVVLCGGAIALTIWPFWLWIVRQPAQVPINQLSRHSVLDDPEARFASLWLPYSLWLLAIPSAAVAVIKRRGTAGLALSAWLVFILSLGGTTPLPHLLYGSTWQWLTYERYALWAGCLLLPIAGEQLYPLARRLPAAALNLGAVALVIVMASSLIQAGWYATLAKLEPEPINFQPIVQFLAWPSHQGWRYLTLGLGDQMSLLSALTPAWSVDGNYNTARSDPLLRQSGVDKLDSIRYWDPQAGVLRTYLRQPQMTGLRWVFANEDYYDQLLRHEGWRPLDRLADGIVVWAKPKAPPKISLAAPPPKPLESAWWGTIPLAALLVHLWLTVCGFTVPRFTGLIDAWPQWIPTFARKVT